MIVIALMVNWDTEVPTNTKVSSFQVTRPALARLARETEDQRGGCAQAPTTSWWKSLGLDSGQSLSCIQPELSTPRSPPTALQTSASRQSISVC